MLMNEKISVRFDFEDPVTLAVPTEEKISVVLSDAVKGDETLLIFADKDTVAGVSPHRPLIFSEKFPKAAEDGELSYIKTNGFVFCLYRERNRFVFLRAGNLNDAAVKSKAIIGTDIESLFKEMHEL